MIGTTISHYRVLEKLGEGGMGVVYKARDTRLDRDVALKFLPSHVSATKETTARFLQEAKAAAALNHANICTIYGVEEHADADGPIGSNRMFIAMEYIDGGTLREKLPLAGIADVVAIAAQVGEALHEAHSKGIVHRDIKADNVMLTSKGGVKVMDFGLAKLKGSLKLTKTSSTVGTLGYMAPEQIGGGEVDARSDLFSFGVLIFEMLTGRLPFRGEHEAAMVYSIMNEQPEPLTKFLPDAPAELVLLTSKALEKEPAERYQSVAEMLVDLRRLKKSTTRVSRSYPLQARPGDGGIPSSRIATQGGSGFHPAQGSGSGTVPAGDGGGKRPKKIPLIAGTIILIAAAIVVFRMMKEDRIIPSAANVKMSRLTSSGDAGYATISPDGKYVVYVKGVEGERGLWIRQVASGTDINVIPPSDVRIIGSSFSNDGNYVYYTAALPEAPLLTVYRTPVIGGAPPRKIIENVDSPVSLSPDDSRLAFFRVFPGTGEEAIFIANADGSGERKLISRDGKNLFYAGEGATPAWSPDGSVIVSPAGTTVGKFSMDIVAIPVDEPAERMMTQMRLSDIGRIAWYPDGRGLIACTNFEGEPATQISYISYPDGEVTRITNDLLSYGPSSLSITKDASAIVSAQSQSNSTVMIVPRGDASSIREVTRGATRNDGQGGLDWIDNERMVYTSYSNGMSHLWVAGSGASDPSQLTFSGRSANDPSTLHPGGVIFYVSNNDTLPCIWRMNADGSNAARVTDDEDYNPEVSPDGHWLLFDSWRSGARSLWKLKIGSADTATMFRHGAVEARFSPDGRLVACWLHDEKIQRSRMTILSFPDGATVSAFDFPGASGQPDFQWAPDGKAIHFSESRKGVDNIRAYDYRTGKVTDVTKFTSGDIYNFAWSPDGKNLAVARGQSTSDIVLITISK